MNANETPKAIAPVVRNDCPFKDENMGLPERCEGTCGANCPLVQRHRDLIPLKHIEVNDSEYRFSHGHAPRVIGGGRAPWAFEIKGVTYWLTGGIAECRNTAKRIAQFKGAFEVKVLS